MLLNTLNILLFAILLEERTHFSRQWGAIMTMWPTNLSSHRSTTQHFHHSDRSTPRVGMGQILHIRG